MSAIVGTGHGASHNWARGYTSPMQNTAYRCRDCGAGFVHWYEVTPDIFDAMRLAGVADRCPVSAGSSPTPEQEGSNG
jgi:hypothetical protein